MRYPHLKDNSFPNVDGVDVYKYQNTFDYRKWNVNTIIKFLNAPWNEDYSNVPGFETDAARDKWIDEHTEEQFVLDTVVAMKPDGSVKIPVPADICEWYNYIAIELPETPVEFGGEDRIGKYFYFVQGVKQLAPSTTELTLKLDAWTTYIHLVDINYMMLHRGHAPMAAISATQYLSDPINNNQYLLTPDVNFGEANIIKDTEAEIFNSGECYAVIASTASPRGNWGSKANNTWTVPRVNGIMNNQGVPSVWLSAIPAVDLYEFFVSVNNIAPQFVETIQGVYFICKPLIVLGDHYTFCEHQIYDVSASNSVVKSITLNKNMFHIPSEYDKIAKLYTHPYSELEISDEKGNKTSVRVEDTTGKLDINAALSIAYPFMSIDAWINGINGTTNNTYTFKNMSNHSFNGKGDWWSMLSKYNIPSFAIVQTNNITNDYRTHYQRDYTEWAGDQAEIQAVLNNETSYVNSVNSNKTANDNAVASANTSYNNTDRSATLNTNNINDTTSTQWKLYQEQTQPQAILAVAVNNTMNGRLQINNAENVGITGLTNMGLSIAGGPASMVGSAANMVGSMITTANNQELSQEICALNKIQTDLQYSDVNTTISDNAATHGMVAQVAGRISPGATTIELGEGGIQTATIIANNDLSKRTVDRNNATSRTNSDASRNTSIANANRTKTTSDANALRTQTRGNQYAANINTVTHGGVTADVNAANIAAPNFFGEFKNGEDAATRPQGMFVSVKTQNKSAIKSAGDTMLRYGYTLDQAWQLNGWNVMKEYTYWQAEDIWITGHAEAPQETIKGILKNGVTVWRNPDHIGKVSIYDNWR